METTPENSISIYQESPHDDFPVLRAFQQYIDAEQEKARKRMLSLSIFFGCLMTVVIVFFLILMTNASARNQLLNDRLVEYAMKDRERSGSVVVQQPVDNRAILELSSKIDEIQKNLAESQRLAAEAEQARQEALREAEARHQQEREAQAKADAERKTQESLEIERLKALLAAEREKASAERERKREEELEAYRRKHYPEYYEKLEKEKNHQPEQKMTAPEPEPVPVAQQGPQGVEVEAEIGPEDPDGVDPIEQLLSDLSKDQSLEDNDGEAISYFDEESDPETQKKSYTIPIDVKGSRSKWRIPSEAN